jgi:hypothetical protein
MTVIRQKFCADRLNDSFATPNTINRTESRRTTRADYVVSKEELRNLCIIVV